MALARVFRLRPRRRVEFLQETLDFREWSEPVRLEINQAITEYLPDEAIPRWPFIMVNAEAEVMSTVLKAIGNGPRAFTTLKVWMALFSCMRMDTAEIIATQRTVATRASVTQGDVSRAYARLVELNMLIKVGKGSYRMHPGLVWQGALKYRAPAEAGSPKLRLINT